MRNWIVSLAALQLALTHAAVFAEDAQSSDAATEAAADTRPAATIADMEWLAGSWEGSGIGGNPAGETFSFAGDGQMVGHFWQQDGSGGIAFYELITIVPDGDSLVMRLKHFNGDLAGWEEKEGDAALEFPLKQRGDQEWVFGPVTFTMGDPEALGVAVTVRTDAGELDQLRFTYTRAGQD